MKDVNLKTKKSGFFRDVDIVGGPIIKSMIIYTIPLILTNVLQFLYNAVDVMVVGNFASGGAVAAVGATTSIINLVVNVVMGMSVGSSILIARSIGEKSDTETPKIINTSLILSLSFGIVALLVGEIFALPMLRLTDCPDSIIDGAALYIRIYMLGMPAMAFYNYMSCVVRSVGDSRRPLIYLTVSGLANVSLNLIFVIVFSMDVAGVATATVISQYLSAILLFIRLTKLDGACRLTLSGVRMDFRYLLKILRYGIPNMVANLAFSVANVQIQTGVNSYGDAAIAGYTAASNIQGIFVSAFTAAFAIMTSTFVGENIGAGDRRRTLKVTFSSYAISFSCVTLSSLLCLLLREPLLSLFVPNQPDAIAYGVICNNYLVGTAFLLGIIVTNNQLVQAFGFTTYQMVVSLICMCGFRMLWLAVVYPHFTTFECLMITYPLSWTLNLLFVIPLIIYCLSAYRRGKDFKL